MKIGLIGAMVLSGLFGFVLASTYGVSALTLLIAGLMGVVFGLIGAVMDRHPED